MKDFDNELHEELFCMLIGIANSFCYRISKDRETERHMLQLIRLIKSEYQLMYEDRSIHQEKYVGFLSPNINIYGCQSYSTSFEFNQLGKKIEYYFL